MAAQQDKFVPALSSREGVKNGREERSVGCS